MRFLTFVLAIMVLTGCSDRTDHDDVSKKRVDTVSLEKVPVDSITNEESDPIIDLNDFSVRVDDRSIDSLNDLFSTGKGVQVFTKTDLCLGDCCTSYKKMVDNETHSTFCFFKTDCGDHGFSNSQFFFSQDSLSIVRNYDLELGQWPTDSTETMWSIKEEIFLFSADRVMIRSREKLTSDRTSFSFGNMPFKERTGDRLELIKEKTSEYRQLLTGGEQEQ